MEVKSSVLYFMQVVLKKKYQQHYSKHFHFIQKEWICLKSTCKYAGCSLNKFLFIKIKMFTFSRLVWSIVTCMNYNQKKKKKKPHQLNLQPKNVIILRLSSKKSYLQHNKISSKATVISDINIPIPQTFFHTVIHSKICKSCGHPLLPGQLHLFLKETLIIPWQFWNPFLFFCSARASLLSDAPGAWSQGGRKGKVSLCLIINPNIHTQAPVHVKNSAPTFQ